MKANKAAVSSFAILFKRLLWFVFTFGSILILYYPEKNKELQRKNQ